MFGKKKHAEPPSEDELRARIKNAIDTGTGFIALRKGLIAAGSDVKVVDRIIAEILHERSGAEEKSLDPFLKRNRLVTPTESDDDDELDSYVEKPQRTAGVALVDVVKSTPSKLISRIIFIITFFCAVAASVYVFTLYRPQVERTCEDGGATSLLCVERLLDRFYQTQGEYPDRLDLLVPRYAVLPVLVEETKEPFFYTMLADGTGYRLCLSVESPDEFCSIRSIRAQNTVGTSTESVQ